MGVVAFIEPEIAPLVAGVNCFFVFFLFDGVFVLLLLRELWREGGAGHPAIALRGERNERNERGPPMTPD